MKTIRASATPIEPLNQVWLLPGLSGRLALNHDGAATFWPEEIQPRHAAPGKAAVAPRRATSPDQGLARAGWPQAREGTAEGITLGLLALAAAAGIVQSLATLVRLAPNWEWFCVWVSKLIG